MFESALRDVTDDCSITLPIWEWELDAGNQDNSAPFRSSTFGSVDDVGGGGTVTEGVARCPAWTILGDCIDREFDDSDNGARFTSQTGLLNRITSDATYFEFNENIEGGPHAAPHIWVGGNMGQISTSPDDPIFWLHHGNVDRIHALWQDYRGQDELLPRQLTSPPHFAGGLDDPMGFNGEGFQPYFQLPGENRYPTPREVLLNTDIVTVTYVEDSLAEALRNSMAGDGNPSNDYVPNPAWFTLPESISQGPEPPVPIVYSDPASQDMWEDLMGQGLSAEDAIHEMALAECGPDNPFMVPQSWIDNSTLPEKVFRCFVE